MFIFILAELLWPFSRSDLGKIVIILGFTFIIVALFEFFLIGKLYGQLMFVAYIFYSNLLGTIFLITGLLLIGIRIYWYLYEIKKGQPKGDYKDKNWLKYQIYNLGKSIQDIADNQNASTIKIADAVEKLKND